MRRLGRQIRRLAAEAGYRSRKPANPRREATDAIRQWAELSIDRPPAAMPPNPRRRLSRSFREVSGGVFGLVITICPGQSVQRQLRPFLPNGFSRVISSCKYRDDHLGICRKIKWLVKDNMLPVEMCLKSYSHILHHCSKDSCCHHFLTHPRSRIASRFSKISR